MIAALRVFLVLFVLLSALYLALSARQRCRERHRLEAKFDAEGLKADREDYIKQGLEDFSHSLRYRLILGVYVVPILVVAALIYVMNFM